MVSLHAHNRSHFLRLVFTIAPIFAVIALLSTVCTAQNPVVRIEEDWEMVVTDPDVNSNGPQVACSISPVGNLDTFHAIFELNHCSSPEFVNGGLYLNIWNGEQYVETRAFPDMQQMSTPGECVAWTQSLDIQSGQLVFEIVGGQSTTWGNFGGQGNLKATISTGTVSLDNYSPLVSAANSGVTFASNCVSLLVLRRIRVVRADGTVLTVVLDQVVHGSSVGS